VILPGTAAYLECSASDRMDAGDHWIVYATVDDGKVTDESALGAVHHRKVGTTY
jgi:flavin reductase (DIM6/NTAB) family NADH-FMN oxidoreductase RutF